MSPNLFELIADPVRLAIVRQLSAGESVPLAEIAARACVHANTARSHIGDLEAAGAVEREHASSEGPGRPQVRYRLSPGWRLPDSELRGLSELLVALAVRLDPSVETITELGRHWGRHHGARPAETLPGLLERLGFDAELDGLELRLRSCPCPLVSPEHPELICRLAGATIDGAAESSGRRLRVASSAHDPTRRSCTIRLSPA